MSEKLRELVIEVGLIERCLPPAPFKDTVKRIHAELDDEVQELLRQVVSLRTRAESAEKKLDRFYSEHHIGWCGHHGYQGMKDESESCPKCRAESAERERDEALAALGKQCNDCEAYAKGQRDRTEEIARISENQFGHVETRSGSRQSPSERRRSRNAQGGL